MIEPHYFYFLLVIVTVLIAEMSRRIYRKTRHLGYPIGFAVLYYWLLFGAWHVVIDQDRGYSTLTYEYLYKKLYPLVLDASYIETLALYSVFIVVAQATILAFSKSTGISSPYSSGPLRISHPPIIAFSALAGTGTVYIMYDYLSLAIQADISAYIMTRFGGSELRTFYQLLQRTALDGSAIGLAVAISGRRGRFLAGTAGPLTIVSYVALISGMLAVCLILGNRNEAICALLTGLLVYEANDPNPKKLGIVLVGATALALVSSIGVLRGKSLSGALESLDPYMLLGSVLGITGSIEAFAGHISLYAIIHERVPLLYGLDFVALGASIVPRVLWPDRPDDSYIYYATRVGASTGQGFTMAHPTGWYLNFGLVGVVIGAVILGYIWLKLYNMQRRSTMAFSAWKRVAFFLAPLTFTAFMPAFIRAGITGYKSVIVEGILIPIGAIWLGVWFAPRSRRYPRRV